MLYLFFSAQFAAVLMVSFLGQFSWGYFLLAFSVFMGFPLKLAFHLFSGRTFAEPVGNFSYTAAQFDAVLQVGMAGAMGLLFAWGLVRNGLIPVKITGEHEASAGSSLKNRFCVFLLAMALVILSNQYFGIFRVGLPSATILPLRGNLLVFAFFNIGIGILLADLLYRMRNTRVHVLAKVLLISGTGAAVSLSIISRSTMVFLSLPLMLALFFDERRGITARQVVLGFLIWGLLFCATMPLIAYLRYKNYSANFSSPGSGARYSVYLEQVKRLFVDRWVGFEGVAAVSNAEGLGFPLFKAAVTEDYKKGAGIYQELINSVYIKSAQGKGAKVFHGFSPGFMAVLYYSGSYWVVFLGTFLSVFLVVFVERALDIWGTGGVYLKTFIGCFLGNMLAQLTYPRMAMVGIVELLTLLFLYFAVSRIMAANVKRLACKE